MLFPPLKEEESVENTKHTRAKIRTWSVESTTTRLKTHDLLINHQMLRRQQYVNQICFTDTDHRGPIVKSPTKHQS